MHRNAVFFCCCFFGLCKALLVEQLKTRLETGWERERERERDAAKGPRLGFEPWAAAVRTEPLHMGHPLQQLSQTAPLELLFDLVTGDKLVCSAHRCLWSRNEAEHQSYVAIKSLSPNIFPLYCYLPMLKCLFVNACSTTTSTCGFTYWTVSGPIPGVS